jgi:hypothetical protein
LFNIAMDSYGKSIINDQRANQWTLGFQSFSDLTWLRGSIASWPCWEIESSEYEWIPKETTTRKKPCSFGGEVTCIWHHTMGPWGCWTC